MHRVFSVLGRKYPVLSFGSMHRIGKGFVHYMSMKIVTMRVPNGYEKLVKTKSEE